MKRKIKMLRLARGRWSGIAAGCNVCNGTCVSMLDQNVRRDHIKREREREMVVAGRVGQKGS